MNWLAIPDNHLKPNQVISNLGLKTHEGHVNEMKEHCPISKTKYPCEISLDLSSPTKEALQPKDSIPHQVARVLTSLEDASMSRKEKQRCKRSKKIVQNFDHEKDASNCCLSCGKSFSNCLYKDVKLAPVYNMKFTVSWVLFVGAKKERSYVWNMHNLKRN